MRVVFLMMISLSVLYLTAAKKYKLRPVDESRVHMALANDRVFKSFYDCLLDYGKCTQSGLKFKQLIPKAMATDCADCSDRQKGLLKYIGKYMMKNRPSEWQKICQKYDPKKKFVKKFKDFLDD